jgi:hypothetical protein
LKSAKTVGHDHCLGQNMRSVMRSEGFSRAQVGAAVAVAASLLVGGMWLTSEQRTDDEQAARGTAERLLSAASEWKRATTIKGCPTVSQLLLDRQIDKHAAADDPWGSRYRIQCTPEAVQVRSAGADREFQTSDDITLSQDWRS